MGIEVPVGFAQVVIRLSLLGDAEPMVTTLGIDMTTNFATPAEVAGAIYDALIGADRPCTPAGMINPYALEGVSVSKMEPTGFDTGERIQHTQGTGAGTTLPPNCAVLIRKNTAIGGRHGRGRMYWPPLFRVEGDVSANGVLTSPTNISTVFNLWRIEMEEEPIVGQFYLFHGLGSGVVPTPISSFDCDPLIATQRRRLR